MLVRPFCSCRVLWSRSRLGTTPDGVTVDTISDRRNALLQGVGTNSKAVGDLILSISNVYALPSKEAGIDGPGARSEHGQGGTEGSQQDIAPRIMGMREGAPNLNDCQKYSRDGRP